MQNCSHVVLYSIQNNDLIYTQSKGGLGGGGMGGGLGGGMNKGGMGGGLGGGMGGGGMGGGLGGGMVSLLLQFLWRREYKICIL